MYFLFYHVLMMMVYVDFDNFYLCEDLMYFWRSYWIDGIRGEDGSGRMWRNGLGRGGLCWIGRICFGLLCGVLVVTL